MQAIHIKVKGKVQGVFYRSTAKKQADHLGLSGWIKNCRDGSVELHVQGTDEQVKKMLAWCRQGPESAEVSDVVVEQSGELPVNGFDIRRY